MEAPMLNRTEMEALFGPPISRYTRAQAIADGVLVDLSRRYPNDTKPFKYPVACTESVWELVKAANGDSEK